MNLGLLVAVTIDLNDCLPCLYMWHR